LEVQGTRLTQDRMSALLSAGDKVLFTVNGKEF